MVTHDARVAALMRRALAPPLRPSAWTPQALLAVSASSGSSATPTTTTTFTQQQQLLQEIYDTNVTYHDVPASAEDDKAETPPSPAGGATNDVERLISELYDLRESLHEGSHASCGSSAERAYLSLLEHDITALLASAVRAAGAASGPSASAKEACRALLTLCVKPTALAREVAFSLLHDVAVHATLFSMEAPQLPHVMVQLLQNELFACLSDMIVKSVAVASTQDGAAAMLPGDSAWVLQATACLVPFVRSTGGRCQYRIDRLVRVDASALTFLTRRVFSLTTAASREAELQDTLLEILVAAMYAHHTRTITGDGERIAMADVERFGGVDLLLAILYGGTASDRTRRLVLGVVFDLVVDQLEQSKPHVAVDGKPTWASYDRLLGCLHECEFASLVASYPVTFVNHAATTARRVKILHGAVENELLETHVAAMWSTLRAMLQLDEYFVHSASLAHARKLLANATPPPHESLAELIVTKTQQLIFSSRLEERFKGERWLAELLIHGLPQGGASDSNDGASTQPLLGDTMTAPGDQLEESLCYDEAADIRLTARTKLWELSRSPSVASRLAFARVLALFTKRRVRLGAPSTSVSAHLLELNPCLDALVSQSDEDSPAVLLTVLDTLLHVVVTSYDVPYLDAQRQRYDFESSDAPQELVGALVASQSLASKILRGVVAIDRAQVSEISLSFLLHTLDVLDATLCPSPASPVSNHAPTLASDYGAVAALLVSYALEDAPVHHEHTHAARLAPFLDSLDTRIAVIAARSITAQLKRDVGDQRYVEIVRDVHAAAVESDDEAPLANTVDHARMLLQKIERTP